VTPDTITLTLPPEREFQRVAHLVLGGLAVRLNLTLEALEDLQLALDGLLDSGSAEEEVTLQLRVVDGAIEASVGPFRAESVQHALEAEADGVCAAFSIPWSTESRSTRGRGATGCS
jgi:hypothetical protein